LNVTSSMLPFGTANFTVGIVGKQVGKAFYWIYIYLRNFLLCSFM
jgi:hypothetical protein